MSWVFDLTSGSSRKLPQRRRGKNDLQPTLAVDNVSGKPALRRSSGYYVLEAPIFRPLAQVLCRTPDYAEY